MTAKRVQWSPEIIASLHTGGIPWTAEENKRLFDMLQEECSLREISIKLNRSYVSVKDKVNRLCRSGENARQPSTQKRVIARDIKEKAGKTKVKCLKCLNLFDSYDPRRNRICVRCKGNEDWK